MKRSAWVTGAIILQCMSALLLIGIAAYVLVLSSMQSIRATPEAISGLRIAAAVLGPPGFLILLSAYGMWKERLWGWWLALVLDIGWIAVLAYSMVDDGWNNVDPEVAVILAVSLVPAVLLLVPSVRKFYWGRPASVQIG